MMSALAKTVGTWLGEAGMTPYSAFKMLNVRGGTKKNFIAFFDLWVLFIHDE